MYLKFTLAVPVFVIRSGSHFMKANKTPKSPSHEELETNTPKGLEKREHCYKLITDEEVSHREEKGELY